MKLEIAKRIGLVVLSLFIAVLIIEGTLRIAGWGFRYFQELRNEKAIAPTTAEINLDRAKETQLAGAAKQNIVILCVFLIFH